MAMPTGPTANSNISAAKLNLPTMRSYTYHTQLQKNSLLKRLVGLFCTVRGTSLWQTNSYVRKRN